MSRAKLYEFPIKWKCPVCGHDNETEVNWVGVVDGQGFVDKCKGIDCGKDIEVDLSVTVKPYKQKIDRRI